MKKIKVILCLLLMSVATAFAGDLSPVQEKAQRSIYSFLLKNKYDPTVDTSDNSVCFRKNDVLYWIRLRATHLCCIHSTVRLLRLA